METKEQNQDILEFRYKRSQRLETAPQNVKDYYDGNFKMVEKGLFKGFFQNKSTKLMFFVVIFLIALSYFLNYFGNSENIINVEGIQIELAAVVLEDTLYCSLMFSDFPDFGAREEFVIATFNIYDSENNLINTDFDSGIYNGKKTYFRSSFTDYEIKKIQCELDFCDNMYILKTGVK